MRSRIALVPIIGLAVGTLPTFLPSAHAESGIVPDSIDNADRVV